MNQEQAPRLQARTAGALYFIVVGASLFAAFTRSALIVHGEAVVTAANVLTSDLQFRFAFAADLISSAAYIGVTALLYDVLRPAGKSLTLLAALFGLAGAGVMAMNMANQLAPLFFLGDASYLAALESDQLQALARVSLRMHALGYNIAGVFFGLQLLLWGWLILKSVFLPRLLGALLVFAAFCYETNAFAGFLAPAFAAQLPSYILLPGLVAEGGLALWLIVFGLNVAKWKEQANATGNNSRATQL